MELFRDLLVVWECGGGTILIFLLTSINGVEQHVAQGANLIFFIPTCAITTIINLKNKNIQKKTALIIVISGVVGAIIGAEISSKIDVHNLRKLFGIFLIIIAIFEIYSLIKSHIKNKKANNKNKKVRKEGGNNMKFFKGVLFGTALSAGAMMLYSEMSKSEKKKLMKKIWTR